VSLFANLFDKAVGVRSAGTSAFLALALGTAPDGANRIGMYADTTASAEQLVMMVGAQTGPAFQRNGSSVIASGLKVQDSTFQITDNTDPTKSLAFQVGTQSSGFQLTIDVGAQAANRTLSVPVLSGNRTLSLIDQAQTVSGAQTFTQPLTLSGSPGGLGGATRYIGMAGTATTIYYNATTGGAHLLAVNEVVYLQVGAGAVSLPNTTTLNVSSTASNATVAASNSVYTSGGLGVAGACVFEGNVYLKSVGPSLTIGNGTGTPALFLNQVANGTTGITWQTAGVARWLFYVTNAETGSDAGCDLVFGRAFTDAGVGIDNPITITRAAGGKITITRPIDHTATFNLTSASNGLNILKTSGTTLTVSSTTDASSSTAASTTLAGGLAVAKGQYVGTFLSIGTTCTLTQATGTTLTVSSTAASTSTTTGAQTIAGGLGVAGAIYAGSLAASGLTPGRIPYMTTGGLLTDNARFQFASSNNVRLILGDGTSGTGNTRIEMNTVAGSATYIQGLKAGLSRWLMNIGNSNAETGSNAGSNFELFAYDDAGSVIDAPIFIYRAAGGVMTIARPLALTNTTDASSSTAASTTLAGGLAVAKGQYIGTFLVIGTTLTVNGTSVTLADACNLALGTTTGTKIGTATTQKIGFWNATPIVQPSAYTQTYNTPARTVNAYTTDAESSAYTGINNAQAGTPYAQLTDLNSLRVAYENLRASHDNLLQVVTALIDDHQAIGLCAP
jgi:hypothetical protein